jgi:hypothetical protein
VVNISGGVWPMFYIFKGESLWDDFIKLYKLETYMAMLQKAWAKCFSFTKFK